MNLGINNSNQNLYCNRYNANPSFGMALKLDKTAHRVIKHQALKLGEKSREQFFKGLSDSVKNQKSNPVNIILRKSRNRDALVAEIVDSEDGRKLGAAKNFVISQPIFFFKNGNLKFLRKAEKKANELNSINSKVNDVISSMEEAEAKDYGKIIK